MSGFFSNANVNRLSAHTALRQLAYGIGGVFSAVFLLRVGITPVGIFLVFAAVFLVRFALRPPALLIIRAIGLRPALMAGTVLMATQYPLLALVTGMGPALVFFCLVSALANVLYWPCYHTMFSAVGDVQRRGSQVGARQMLGAVAGICGPAAGGLALALFGPWAAFGAAAVIEAAAILPLLRVPAPSLPNGGPNDTREGFLLFATDAWVINGSAFAWYMVMFPVLQSRFDAFGGVLALAAFAGAIAGLVVGHFIDKGHGRRAVLLNAILVFASMVVRAFCGSEPIAIVAAAVFTAVTGGALHSDAHERRLQRGEGISEPAAVPIRGGARLGCRGRTRVLTGSSPMRARHRAPAAHPSRNARSRGAGLAAQFRGETPPAASRRSAAARDGVVLLRGGRCRCCGSCCSGSTATSTSAQIISRCCGSSIRTSRSSASTADPRNISRRRAGFRSITCGRFPSMIPTGSG